MDNQQLDKNIKALKNTNAQVRRKAAQALGRLRAKQALEELINSLADEDQEVRYWTVWSLGELGNIKATLPIINMIEKNVNNEKIYGEIINTLGKLRDVRAFEVVVKALNNKNWWVSQRAAWALGEIGDRRAIDPLLICIKTGNESSGVEAAKSLAKIENTEVVNALIEILKSQSSIVRQNAAFALGEMGDRRAVEPLIESLEDENPCRIQIGIGSDALLMMRARVRLQLVVQSLQAHLPCLVFPSALFSLLAYVTLTNQNSPGQTFAV